MGAPTVLIVDDEPLNAAIAVEILAENDIGTDVATCGATAWEKIAQNPGRYDAILLDRVMPHMSGMELLQKLKASPEHALIPAILQTARVGKADIVEGLQAGAHYYLCKPYDDATLLAVVNTAIGHYERYRTARAELAATTNTLELMQSGTFRFRTLHDARVLSALLGKMSAMPDRLAVGLLELFVNAVEHGNLGLGYNLKSTLNSMGQWSAEIERLLALVEHAHKYVTVDVARAGNELHFRICDQGEGFDWRDYLDLSPNRAFDNHGRGIAMSRLLSFTRLEYQGRGNEVLAVAEVDALTGN